MVDSTSRAGVVSSNHSMLTSRARRRWLGHHPLRRAIQEPEVDMISNVVA